MEITTITRFHYPRKHKDKKEYKWRFNFFKDKVLPRIKAQDTDINVWCNDWQRDSLEELGVNAFNVDTKTRTNKLGYFVDFADWSKVEGLKKYDIQIGIDSDDLITSNLVDKVKEVCSEKEQSTHISFQPIKVDLKTGKQYDMKRTYNKKGSPIFAIYQPDKENYLFAYENSHLLMPIYFREKVFINKGYCYISVHNYNDSTTIKS